MVSSTGFRFIHGDNCTSEDEFLSRFFAGTDGRGKAVSILSPFNCAVNRVLPLITHNLRFQLHTKGHYKKAGVSNSMVFLIWIMVFVMVGGAFSSVYFWFLPPSIKERVEEITTPMSDAINTAFGWAKQKIAVVSPR